MRSITFGSLALLILAGAVLAEERLEVYVRTVQARDPLHNGGDASLQLDNRLSDIRPKLVKLPYRSFSLIGQDKRVVAMKHKEVIQLAQGQSLSIRPLYGDEERVGLWLRWLDNGAEVLDTRMHFDCQESMIAGTDNDPSRATILAIDVRPVKSGDAAP